MASFIPLVDSFLLGLSGFSHDRPFLVAVLTLLNVLSHSKQLLLHSKQLLLHSKQLLSHSFGLSVTSPTLPVAFYHSLTCFSQPSDFLIILIPFCLPPCHFFSIGCHSLFLLPSVFLTCPMALISPIGF